MRTVVMCVCHRVSISVCAPLCLYDGDGTQEEAVPCEGDL